MHAENSVFHTHLLASLRCTHLGSAVWEIKPSTKLGFVCILNKKQCPAKPRHTEYQLTVLSLNVHFQSGAHPQSQPTSVLPFLTHATQGHGKGKW